MAVIAVATVTGALDRHSTLRNGERVSVSLQIINVFRKNVSTRSGAIRPSVRFITIIILDFSEKAIEV